MFNLFRFSNIEEGDLPPDQEQARRLVLEKPNFHVVDGLLCHTNPALPDKLQLVVPNCLKSTLLRESHNGKFAGHFAERKLYATLRTKYWWKGMRSDVHAHCHSCIACVSRKGPGRKTRAAL